MPKLPVDNFEFICMFCLGRSWGMEEFALENLSCHRPMQCIDVRKECGALFSRAQKGQTKFLSNKPAKNSAGTICMYTFSSNKIRSPHPDATKLIDI
jgi:hypothetical protein